MVGQKTRRVDPRALLILTGAKVQSIVPSKSVASEKSGLFRLVTISLASIVGLSSFGAIVVRANDDNGALAFIRQQPTSQNRPSLFSRPVARAAPVYYAPLQFFPRASAPARKRDVIVASYAPFGGYFPTETTEIRQPRRKAAVAKVKSVRLALPAPARESRFFGGSGVTYCVRTCDGFYFPLSTATGSVKADEAACNRLCPTTETKVFVGQGGADFDEARARSTGKTYATLNNAFSYRKSVDKSCSCSTSGVGLTADYSIYRDESLRVGDVIMTKTGMKVFSGGNMPYREANFRSLRDSNLLDSKTREHLRLVENASIPGRSGIPANRVETRNTVKTAKPNELKELKAATALAEQARQQQRDSVARYVGPDRSIASR